MQKTWEVVSINKHACSLRIIKVAVAKLHLSSVSTRPSSRKERGLSADWVKAVSLDSEALRFVNNSR